MLRKVSVLGAGAFGTAISMLLSDSGNDVLLWANEALVADQINYKHENNSFFPGFSLAHNIKATTNLTEFLNYSPFIFIAVPVKFLRSVLDKVKKFDFSNRIFINLSKGFESSTFLLPTQIIQDVLDINLDSLLVLAGPNFAIEIGNKKRTFSVLAGKSLDNINAIKNMMDNEYFKTEVSRDVIGVQIGGAFKNLISLSVGLITGQGFGKNYSAYFISKCFEELISLAKSLGANEKTIYGISGFGDLYLSSTSEMGRNYSIGIEIGELIKENKFDKNSFFRQKNLPEGINTLIAFNEYISKKKLEFDFLNSAYDVIFS